MGHRPIALSAVLLLFLQVAAGAQDTTYEFRENYREGQQFNVLFSQSTEVRATLYAQGTQVSTFQSVEAAQDKGTIKVLSTVDGVPSAEQMVLDPSCGEFRQRTGQPPKQTYSAEAGKTVIIRRDPTGGVSAEVGGKSEPKLAVQLRNWLDRDSTLYPDHPVRVKEKWDLSKKLTHLVNMRHGEQVTAFCQLRSVKTVKGRDFAELHVTCAMIGTMYDIQVEDQAQGTAWVDLATGRVAKMDLSGDVHVSGNGTARLSDGRLIATSAVGDGKFEYHQLCVAAQAHAGAVASGAN